MKNSRPALRNRPHLLAIAAVLLALASCSTPVPDLNLYVDPVNGVDTNPGTVSAPFKTLTHALSKVVADGVVHLGAGTYDDSTGEVWPTQTGLPPTATPNVPAGVTLTADGNPVRLVGPGGVNTASALVFEGGAAVDGVSVEGFQRGVLAATGATVKLDDVEVTGSSDEGILVYGDARVTISDSHVHANGLAGVAAYDQSVVTLEDSQFDGNGPGVLATDNSAVTIIGGAIFDNGSAVPGGENSGVSVMNEATLTLQGADVHDNFYAGVHLQGTFDATIGPGTDLHHNFIGVVADAFMGGAASLEFDGAKVRINDYEGVYWAVPMGDSFRMRDTEVTDNGDNALFFHGDAATIDLGTPADPGGNDFSGSGEPLLLDLRPARAAPDGTIITVSYADVIDGCIIIVGPLVGPDNLACNGVTIIGITNANNRVEIVFDD